MPDIAMRLLTEVYSGLANTGRAPTVDELSAQTGATRTVVTTSLNSLHEAHDLVLDTDGEVRMALPFSAVPTPFTVSATGVDYWANCAWDALAIPVALAHDAIINAPWSDDHTPFEMTVRDGALTAPDGLVHYSVPARRWWDDIVDT